MTLCVIYDKMLLYELKKLNGINKVYYVNYFNC